MRRCVALFSFVFVTSCANGLPCLVVRGGPAAACVCALVVWGAGIMNLRYRYHSNVIPRMYFKIAALVVFFQARVIFIQRGAK